MLRTRLPRNSGFRFDGLCDCGAELPSLHHRKEGWVRHQEKRRPATETDATGVVFLLCPIGKPPRPREMRRLRDIFLIARPPLLAVSSKTLRRRRPQIFTGVGIENM